MLQESEDFCGIACIIHTVVSLLHRRVVRLADKGQA